MSPSRPFRFGVNSVTTSRADWLEAARKAEALGYDTLIAQDHFGNQLAPIPSLVAAASVTSHLRLATLVLDNDFRHPALLAKDAATMDVMTDGRFELGIGAGWMAADYRWTGIPFDPPGVRVARLAEAVQIIKAFFAGGPGQRPCLLGSAHQYSLLDVQREVPIDGFNLGHVGNAARRAAVQLRPVDQDGALGRVNEA